MQCFLRYFVPFSILLAVATACSNTRHLTEDQTLYTGPKVNINDTFASKKERDALKTELEEAVRPKPNASIFGIRAKLTLYNLAGVPKKEKGLRNWLRNKIGEPPVLGSDVNIGVNNDLLQNILMTYGYFNAASEGRKETDNHQKTKAIFEVNTGARTYLRNISLQGGANAALAADIKATQENSLLKSGNPFNLQTIRDERIRIDAVLKNKGYYYFSPDYILIDADTGIGNHQADLTLKIKYNEMPEEAGQQWRINTVTVFPEYRLTGNYSGNARGNSKRAANGGSNDSARNANRSSSVNFKRQISKDADTLKFDDFSVVQRRHEYKPYVFYQAMQFEPGELYNKRDQNVALNRLVTLGAFKFVKNEFTRVRDTGTHLLDVSYLLTPYAKKSYTGELGGFTQNDSRGGVRGSVTWRNKNLFRGAEVFSVKLTGSFEAQYGGVSQRPNAYNFGIETNLNVPRFMVPVIDIKPSGMYIPRTIFTAAYNYSLRAGFYRIHSFNLGYGYNWKEEIRKDHKLFPVNITLVRTDTIDASRASEFNFTNLIYNGLIIGPTYTYTFNSQADGIKRPNNYYFEGLVDLSGNILGLAQGARLDDTKKILGSGYAQYLKAQVDFRYYRNLTAKTVLAARAFVGYGYSYGNSYNLPNIKQFFSGGSSSLRGFPSRLVGPGAFKDTTNTVIEVLGDIKMEANVEYRAKLYRFIEGAVFADMGNVWFQRKKDDFPGGEFTSAFYKQLAADAGLGLRFDFSILLLRFDFAFPIRKPWLPEHERWRFNDIRPGSPEWRNENLFFNLAIGYPF
ncbi:MAG: BamA/TamA family outer membrane protein [Edaphocola sp.]